MTALDTTPDTTEAAGDRVVQVDVDCLDPSATNRDVGDVSELAASIEQYGLVQPIVVAAAADGRFRIVAGERRWRAAVLAGADRVPCIVRPYPDDAVTALLLMLVENGQRKDLDPLEEAGAYQQLLDARGPDGKPVFASQRDLARRVAKPQPHVSRRLSLLGLPAKVRDDLESGQLTLTDAQELARLDPPAAANVHKESQGSSERLRSLVAQQLADRERAERRAKVIDELRADGVTVIDAPGAHGPYGIHAAGGALAQVLLSEDDMHPGGVAKKGHATQPCHAAAVIYDATVLWVCTDPKRHGGLGSRNGTPTPERGRRGAQDATDPEADPEKERIAAHRAALADARTARLDWIRTHLRAPLRAAALQHVGRIWATDGLSDDNRYLVDLLSIDGATDDLYGLDGPLFARIDTGTADTIRVLLAAALATVESQLAAPAGWWVDDGIRLHFDYLAAAGYTPSAAERAELDKKRARP